MQMQLKIMPLLAILVACLAWPAFAQNNTLVTGVISDQRGQMPNDLIEVQIYLGSKKLMDIQARDGLFSVDLQGKAKPQDEITLTVRTQTFDKLDPQKARRYQGLQRSIQLAEAQNLNLDIKFEYLKDQPEVGPFPEIPTK